MALTLVIEGVSVKLVLWADEGSGAQFRVDNVSHEKLTLSAYPILNLISEKQKREGGIQRRQFVVRYLISIGQNSKYAAQIDSTIL